MYLSYFPLRKKSRYGFLPFILPCVVANPVNLLYKENRVFVIHTPEDLPEDIVIAFVCEMVIYNRTKTLLYSYPDTSINLIRRIMEQVCGLEDFLRANTWLPKEVKTMAKPYKTVEKAPLYINDRQMDANELLDNIRSVLCSARIERSPFKIVFVNDLFSVKGLSADGKIDRDSVIRLVGMFKELSSEYNVSLIIMSRKSLRTIYGNRKFRKVFAVMNGQEYSMDSVILE